MTPQDIMSFISSGGSVGVVIALLYMFRGYLAEVRAEQQAERDWFYGNLDTVIDRFRGDVKTISDQFTAQSRETSEAITALAQEVRALTSEVRKD